MSLWTPEEKQIVVPELIKGRSMVGYSRRGFLGMIAAAVGAGGIAEPEIYKAFRRLNRMLDGWASSPLKLKIGDTITIRRPPRFHVTAGGLLIASDGLDRYTITNVAKPNEPILTWRA